MRHIICRILFGLYRYSAQIGICVHYITVNKVILKNNILFHFLLPQASEIEQREREYFTCLEYRYLLVYTKNYSGNKMARRVQGYL